MEKFPSGKPTKLESKMTYMVKTEESESKLVYIM